MIANRFDIHPVSNRPFNFRGNDYHLTNQSLSTDTFSSLSYDSINGSSLPTPTVTSGGAKYSRKVFVGGLPADVPREYVEQLFSRFGRVVVDWPRMAQHPKERRTARTSLNGYVFLVYEEESSVQKLVSSCALDGGHLFLPVSSPTSKHKPAQVRPWLLENIDYHPSKECQIDPRKTVFIGGVPRPTTAVELARVLESEYGKVAYVGIDIDPDLKYPKGAARVAFETQMAYLSAIRGRFVRIPHVDCNKKEVEIKPYVLDGQPCDECLGTKCDKKSAPYFCGDVSCLQYYCCVCWDLIHYRDQSTRTRHHPLVRLGDQTKLLADIPHLRFSAPLPASALEREMDSLLKGGISPPNQFLDY